MYILIMYLIKYLFGVLCTLIMLNLSHPYILITQIHPKISEDVYSSSRDISYLRLE